MPKRTANVERKEIQLFRKKVKRRLKERKKAAAPSAFTRRRRRYSGILTIIMAIGNFLPQEIVPRISNAKSTTFSELFGWFALLGAMLLGGVGALRMVPDPPDEQEDFDQWAWEHARINHMFFMLTLVLLAVASLTLPDIREYFGENITYFSYLIVISGVVCVFCVTAVFRQPQLFFSAWIGFLFEGASTLFLASNTGFVVGFIIRVVAPNDYIWSFATIACVIYSVMAILGILLNDSGFNSLQNLILRFIRPSVILYEFESRDSLIEQKIKALTEMSKMSYKQQRAMLNVLMEEHNQGKSNSLSILYTIISFIFLGIVAFFLEEFVAVPLKDLACNWGLLAEIFATCNVIE